MNVASRVQSLGIANSILFSSEICSKIKNQQEFKSVSVGRFHFKNVDEPMEVFALANEGLNVPKSGQMEGKLKDETSKNNKHNNVRRSIIMALFSNIGLVNTSFFAGHIFNKTVIIFFNFLHYFHKLNYQKL